MRIHLSAENARLHGQDIDHGSDLTPSFFCIKINPDFKNGMLTMCCPE
jgi:hypothetical protein